MIASTKQQINVNGDENEIHGIETIFPEIEPDHLNLFNVDNLIHALKDIVTISWIPSLASPDLPLPLQVQPWLPLLLGDHPLNFCFL